MTALHNAVKHNSNDAVVRDLIAHGADPAVKNTEGKSAIALARSLKRTRMLKILEGRATRL